MGMRRYKTHEPFREAGVSEPGPPDSSDDDDDDDAPDLPFSRTRPR
jgi:hypothetical protein